MNVQLQDPQLAPPVLSISIPRRSSIPTPIRESGRDRCACSLGRMVNQKREMDHIVVAPGRHAIRVASGAFSVQLGDFDFQPGMSYVIELSMDLNVRGVRATQP